MKYFTFNFNHHHLYQQVIDSNIKAGFDVDVITKPEAPMLAKYSNLAPVLISDIERWYRLTKNPYAVYIDGDTRIIKDPDFEMPSGIPYLYNGGNMVNSCVIIGNGASDFFDLMLSTFDGKNYPTFYFNLLRTVYKNNYQFIPPGYFRHMALGLLLKCPPQVGRIIHGNGYSVKNINGKLEMYF